MPHLISMIEDRAAGEPVHSHRAASYTRKYKARIPGYRESAHGIRDHDNSATFDTHHTIRLGHILRPESGTWYSISAKVQQSTPDCRDYTASFNTVGIGKVGGEKP